MARQLASSGATFFSQ